ncbi:S41 family peptidase [Polluticoccus soli]|uniref:S41 family peptidase n=1 Tax=Polluticoccus soli TaxID=3034150 RepID=UPI0023E2C9D5|nr:S41 family peptidase [Flavipsychrobacter sp. JY13-12]
MKKLLWLLPVLFMLSCEKIVSPSTKPDDPVAIFDELWKTLNEGYSFFDYKGVNWDSVYTVYRPQVHVGMTDRELYEVSVAMLNTLRDGHINLRTGFARSYYNYYADYPPNFNREILERNYWRGFEITGPLIHTIIDSVGYIYYRSFASNFSDEQLDVVLQRFNDYPGIQGVVIDVRNNEGGNPENAYRFLRRVATERTLIYRTQYKDGPAHNEFTELEESYIDPNDKVAFPGKVVVLTNRTCYSACNFFAASVKAFSQVTVIGDTTGGGGGQPVGHEFPNGWAVNFSGSITYMPDGFIIEHGVPPHKYVALLPADEALGIDTILEYAIAFIRQ